MREIRIKPNQINQSHPQVKSMNIVAEGESLKVLDRKAQARPKEISNGLTKNS